jgi:UDP-N-acetylmuramate--alanine ligase
VQDVLKDILKKTKKVHFIGIGGAGMFPIVQILIQKGYSVTGSDSNESDIVRSEKKLGIKVFMSQKEENIKNIKPDLIIYTAAILKDNEELLAAKRSNIPTIERNDFLAYFTKKHKNCICVAGTHGKTTTTSMIVQVLTKSKKSPSAVVGGYLDCINGYGKADSEDLLVCEACEFEDHFLKLFAQTAVILNIDNDHLEYFKNIDNIKKSFKKFCEKTKNTVIYNGDDINTKDCVLNLKKESISFGFSKENCFYAENLVLKDGLHYSFDVFKKGELILKDVELFVPGRHNVLNALACIVVCLKNGVNKTDIKQGLKQFKGAGRRFEVVGKINGITVMDDYAHHPKEIYVTLLALKKFSYKKIWVIHQPFTFSRTAMLKEDFKKALSLADRVIITDILGSREKNDMNISSKVLVDIMPGSIYCPTQEEAADYILKHAEKGDVVITMGCGDIYKCGKMILYGRY